MSSAIQSSCAFAPLSDLAVSVHLPDDLPASFGITGRYARQTNYISPPGDFSAEEVMPVGRLTDDWYFVCGIDVVAPRETGAIVAVGDSLTDANISTHDGHHSWPSQLARRLMARQSGRPMAVMNQGLGGNRILHDIRGDSGLRRFDRDVLAQPGVTHAVIMLGTNDLRNRHGKPEEEVTAAQMIGGLKQFAVRGHARGIQVIGGTLTPFENETFLPGAWNPKREAIRQAVNEWLRKTDAFDAIVDFDRALRDPDHPTRMLPTTIAAITFTRATWAIARWATRSISSLFEGGATMTNDALRTILPIAGWPEERARAVEITGGADPILPTPFRIGETSAAALAAVGLAVCRSVGIAHRAPPGGRGRYCARRPPRCAAGTTCRWTARPCRPSATR